MDAITEAIADYAYAWNSPDEEAISTAKICLADSLGCAIAALRYPACTKLLGPIVPGTTVPNGCRIPGTIYRLDPIRGAFNLGTMIRWLDYNDTWLAAEWGHPSDNIGGLLALMDYLSRKNLAEGKQAFSCQDLLLAIIKAYEIQGVLALTNSFNCVGFDHVIFVKVATTAVAAALLGCNRAEIIDAISNAWVDVCSLRTYRHAPNTGTRKSWAAGDATSRGVQLAWMVKQGEMGYKTALSAPIWGLYDILFNGDPFTLSKPLECYVVKNILFKIAYPAEFHAQTALECAIALHSKIKDSIDQIKAIDIFTQESAVRIIDKIGPLDNPADRDHCLQYIVAIGLLYGTLTADHYEHEIAKQPEIDRLRSKMRVKENPRYSKDYLNPSKRSIANSLEIHFKGDRASEKMTVEYPLGHQQRRQEGIPLIFKKFQNNLKNHYNEAVSSNLSAIFKDNSQLSSLSVPALVDLFCDSIV